ncbi:MAG: exodeoxyribonuclease VII small subunit [Candidatus Zixiibacteriota bacterium]|nr:MAG: exodeoxyribonuclease VII small subunit [candidate division Zixibacteria bacterium]
MAVKKKPEDYESAMTRLEEITEQLESGELKLEKAIDLYTEGLGIAKFCNEKLTQAEEKIKIIAQKDGLTVEKDFDEGEN